MSSFPIFIIRHGLAGQFGDYTNDAERPLTPAGEERVRQVAQKLCDLNVQLEQILTSPYQRAAQTAEILHQSQPNSTVELIPCLQPNGSFTQLLTRLEQHDRQSSIALIGHEPHLSQTAEQLVWGNIQTRIILKKTGIIRLEAPINGLLYGNCELRWLLPAKVLLA